MFAPVTHSALYLNVLFINLSIIISVFSHLSMIIILLPKTYEFFFENPFWGHFFTIYLFYFYLFLIKYLSNSIFLYIIIYF